MAPREGIRCWVCGRTLEEVRQTIGTAAPELTDVDRSMAKVSEARVKFAGEAGQWMDLVPDQFKAMDFAFVIGNPTQFRTIRFLDEVEHARRSHVQELGDVLALAKKGKEFTIGEIKVEANDSRRRDTVVRDLEDFERKSGRALERSKAGDEKEDAGKPSGFNGLKLADGLKYLRDAGLTYYAVQQRILEGDKEDEKKKMPTYEIGMAKIKGFPKAVPICTVCENLIKGL